MEAKTSLDNAFKAFSDAFTSITHENSAARAADDAERRAWGSCLIFGNSLLSLGVSLGLWVNVSDVSTEDVNKLFRQQFMQSSYAVDMPHLWQEASRDNKPARDEIKTTRLAIGDFLSRVSRARNRDRAKQRKK